MDYQPRDYVRPGPEDTTLLKLQPKHRSEGVWQENLKCNVLRCRQHKINDVTMYVPLYVEPYLHQARLGSIVEIGNNRIDNHLITALVERWRPETHTFHLPPGEMTITLQDVQIITGLPIDGVAVMGSKKRAWKDLCANLLGLVPPQNDLKGGKIELGFLDEHFSGEPNPNDIEDVERHARAWILRLFGRILFPNSTGSRIHLIYLSLMENLADLGNYSWGSAVLAHLYRELCRATSPDAATVGGALFIVQVWAWERIKGIGRNRSMDWEYGRVVRANGEQIVSPLARRWEGVKVNAGASNNIMRAFREALDMLKEENIIWQPYLTPEVMARLPPYCTDHAHLWQSVVPLICFCYVEWHQPDRCARQFGCYPIVPPAPYQDDKLHLIDFRTGGEDYPQLLHAYLDLWNQRAERIFQMPAVYDQACRIMYHSDYLDWYTRVTRRWVTPRGALVQLVGDQAEYVHLRLRGGNADAETQKNASFAAFAMLCAVNEDLRLVYDPEDDDPPQGPSFSRPPPTPFRQTGRRKDRRGLADVRTTVEAPSVYPFQVPRITERLRRPPISPGHSDSSESHHDIGGTSEIPPVGSSQLTPALVEYYTMHPQLAEFYQVTIPSGEASGSRPAGQYGLQQQLVTPTTVTTAPYGEASASHLAGQYGWQQRPLTQATEMIQSYGEPSGSHPAGQYGWQEQQIVTPTSQMIPSYAEASASHPAGQYGWQQQGFQPYDMRPERPRYNYPEAYGEGLSFTQLLNNEESPQEAPLPSTSPIARPVAHRVSRFGRVIRTPGCGTDEHRGPGGPGGHN